MLRRQLKRTVGALVVESREVRTTACPATLLVAHLAVDALSVLSDQPIISHKTLVMSFLNKALWDIHCPY